MSAPSFVRFRAAVRKLSQHGAAALQPSLAEVSQEAAEANVKPRNLWKRPIISKRTAKEMRKQAIRDGTYGSFVENQGGWDPAWDLVLLPNKNSQGRVRGLAPRKLASRNRKREERAKKIEATLQDMDERIEEYYQKKQDAKPDKTAFQYIYDKLMKGTHK